MAPNFVRTRGRNVKLAHDGYLYLKGHQLKNGQQKWKCARKWCPARAVTQISTGEVVSATDDHHGHWPHTERIAVGRVLTELKRRAEETDESVSSLIQFALSSVSTCLLSYLPLPSAMEKMIHRYRSSRSKNPETVDFQSSVDSSEPFRVSEYAIEPREDLLLADTSESDPKRIVILGLRSTSQYISFVKKLYVDTSFNKTPSGFAQVVIILAERLGHILPIAYVLLSDRTVESYSRMFSLLKDAWPALEPKTFVIGLEKGLLDSVRACFPPETDVQGRFCDLVDSVKQKISESVLSARYKKGGDFSLKTRMIAALPFVPPSELSSAISKLESELPEELIPILHAFQEAFIGRVNIFLPDGTSTTREPQFPSEVWSVFERARAGKDWVDDHVKETRKRLHIDLGAGIPALSDFIAAVKREQNYVDFYRERYIVGYAAPTRKLSVADQRIAVIVQNAEEKALLEYLQALARNLTMKV